MPKFHLELRKVCSRRHSEVLLSSCFALVGILSEVLVECRGVSSKLSASDFLRSAGRERRKSEAGRDFWGYTQGGGRVLRPCPGLLSFALQGFSRRAARDGKLNSKDQAIAT